MRCICDQVVAHQTMYDTKEGVLKVGSRVEVTALDYTVVYGEDGMRSIGPHNTEG